MTDYRKILMLRSMGCSQREMERNKIASRETSKAVFETADRLGICWPLDGDITNADLERLLFPNKYKDFKVWAMSVGPMTEHVVDFFLESGKAPEQGYKACASLTKLGERYGKERLESACARVHAYGTTPSIRNISSILKSKQDVKAKTSTAQEQSSNTARYGITRGASYFANGGEHK